MKGFMKKAVAVLLAAVMAVAMFAGCSMTKKTGAGSTDSLFGIIKSAMMQENKTIECEVTVEMEGTKAVVKLNGETDGKATVMSANASVGGMSFKLEKVLVFTEDALYINVAKIMDEVGILLAGMSGGASIKLEDYGIKSDWLSFKADGVLKKDTTLFETICDDLDEAYSEVITKKDGTYSINIADKDGAQKFLDATKALLDKNSDKWAKLFAEQANKVDAGKVMNGVVDDLMAAVAKAYEEKTGTKLSDEELEEMKKEMLEGMNIPEMSEVNEDTYKEMFDEAKKSLNEAEVTGDVNGVVDIRASYEKGVYTFKANAKSEEEDSKGDVTVVMTVNSGKAGKVEVPAESQPLIDVLAYFIGMAQDGGSSIPMELE